jgi:hypothetical protein
MFMYAGITILAYRRHRQYKQGERPDDNDDTGW